MLTGTQNHTDKRLLSFSFSYRNSLTSSGQKNASGKKNKVQRDSPG